MRASSIAFIEQQQLMKFKCKHFYSHRVHFTKCGNQFNKNQIPNIERKFISLINANITTKREYKITHNRFISSVLFFLYFAECILHFILPLSRKLEIGQRNDALFLCSFRFHLLNNQLTQITFEAVIRLNASDRGINQLPLLYRMNARNEFNLSINIG